MNESDKSLTIDELLRGIWRRRAMALAVAAVVLTGGALYWLTVPPTYIASSVIRVADQELPVQLLKKTVTDTPEARLTTARQELLSRPVLEKVIDDLGLYASTVQKGDKAGAVTALRKNIDVKVEGEHAIELTITAATARAAADIANDLPRVYADMVLADRAAQADRASRVFADELETLKPQMEGLEREMAQYKVQYAGQLPESLDGNMRQIDRLTTLTNSALENLADAQRRHTALAHQGMEVNMDLERWNAAVNDARKTLAQTRATFTDDSPEVIAARKNFDETWKRFDEASAKARNGDTEDGRIREEMISLRSTTKGYQDQIQEILKRITATPSVGAHLAVLNRDYESLGARFDDLLGRKVEADLNRDLESRQHASLFQVIDPAVQPALAAAPNAVSVFGLSLLMALVLSMGLTGLLAARDTSFSDPGEAGRRLGIPVLAAVPDLDKASKKAG